jgi:SAM-dependent methyltransferase
MFSKFRPLLGRRVLEIGSGIGNMTRYLLDREFFLATEVKPNYLSLLRNRLGKYQKIRIEPFDVLRFDLERFRSRNIDSILCVNVLEHLEDNETPLRNMVHLLEPKGRLFLSVPAHPWLYGTMDRDLGHVRRYEKGDLKKKLEAQGFRVIFLEHFNRIGILGWFLNGKVLRRKGLPFVQLRIFDFLVPLFKLEDLCSLPFGLSLIAVIERPE